MPRPLNSWPGTTGGPEAAGPGEGAKEPWGAVGDAFPAFPDDTGYVFRPPHPLRGTAWRAPEDAGRNVLCTAGSGDSDGFVRYGGDQIRAGTGTGRLGGGGGDRRRGRGTSGGEGAHTEGSVMDGITVRWLYGKRLRDSAR